MANFKRKSPRSGMSKKCTICAGQRRQFGWGTQKAKAMEKIVRRERQSEIV